MKTNGITWCWSMSEDDVVFIFREDSNQELKIYLDEFNPSTGKHNTIYLMEDERNFLRDLIDKGKVRD